MTFDDRGFKDAMRRFTSGVTIVAGMEDGEPVGFTCQSFLSLSIDPPFVAVAPARTSTSWPRIARAGTFCVNVLGDHQEDLCRGFAVSGGDKFAGVDWHPAPATGRPSIIAIRYSSRIGIQSETMIPSLRPPKCSIA